MRSLFGRAVAVLLPLVLSAACEQAKSATPLSPEVAGPMAGISIDPPGTITPGAGAQISDTAQPVSLVLGNPSTNSPRPLQFSVQVALDAGFTNVIFSQTSVAPSAGATTAVPLSGALPNGHTYYWRASASDGANTSGWSNAVFFQILQPVVIGVPTLKSPIGGARVANTTPLLDVVNGVSTGPHSTLHYQFQVSDNQAFANPFVNDAVTENGGGETTDAVTFLTNWNITNYWRVRIFDDTGHMGNWSNVETFLSPLAPALSPTAPPSSGGSSVAGNWDVSKCASMTGDPASLAQCVHDIISPGGSGALAFEVTKRVAWLLRGTGAGLLLKPGGDAIITWRGQSFSISRVCYPDGHLWKDISDAGDGGTNGASWADNGFVDPSLYVPAIDPSLP